MDAHIAAFLKKNVPADRQKTKIGHLIGAGGTITTIAAVKLMLPAEIGPDIFLILGKNKNHRHFWISLAKSEDGMHEYRLAGQQQELLRNRGAHSDT